MTPESEFIIHAHTEADTSSGRSHGTRNNARKVVDKGKWRWKNTASASPIEYWNTRDIATKRKVLRSAVGKAGSVKICV